MNTGFLNVSIDLATDEINVDLTNQEIDTEITNEEINVDLTNQEIDVDMSTEELTCEIENASTLTVDISPSYDIINNKEKDVNFYDYDGTLVRSYYASEFLLLKELPSNPKGHPDLVPQGWNWSLEEARSYVLKYGKCDIGEIYTTYDGTTKIYIDLPEYLLHPYLGLKIDGTINVDWGDGTQEEITGTGSEVLTPHVYQQSGSYVISIDCSDTAAHLYGIYSNLSQLLNGNGDKDYHYLRTIKKIFFGSNVYLDNYSFKTMRLDALSLSNEVFFTDTFYDRNTTFFDDLAIAHLNIPTTIENVKVRSDFLTGLILPGNFEYENSLVNTFSCNGCTRLRRIIIPEGVTNIPENCFGSCTYLESVVIPDNVTTIYYRGFYSITMLQDVILNNISLLSSQTFYDCDNIKQIKLKGDLESLPSYTFYYCSGVESVILNTPNLGEIGSYCFSSCTRVIYYNFTKLNNVPTLNNINAFQYIPDYCQIIVPDSLYDEWINATNWSTLSDHIVKESDYNG